MGDIAAVIEQNHQGHVRHFKLVMAARSFVGADNLLFPQGGDFKQDRFKLGNRYAEKTVKSLWCFLDLLNTLATFEPLLIGFGPLPS